MPFNGYYITEQPTAILHHAPDVKGRAWNASSIHHSNEYQLGSMLLLLSFIQGQLIVPRRLQEINNELNSLRAAVNQVHVPQPAPDGACDQHQDSFSPAPVPEKQLQWLNISEGYDNDSRSLGSVTVTSDNVLELLQQ
jgi:hypothetical protein